MNSKKAKSIRRFVRSLGHAKAELPLHHVNLKGKRVAVTDLMAGFGGIARAKYPNASFQRVYSTAKRVLRALPVAVINARANLNFSAEGRPVRPHRSGGGRPAQAVV